MKILLFIFLFVQILILRIPNFFDGIGKFLILSLFSYITYALLVYKILKSKNKYVVFVSLIAFILWFFYFNRIAYLSNDLYRYFWDGWLVRKGLNPYLFVPSDWNLKFFQNSNLYLLVNWKDQFTPYPPFAQLLFSIAYPIYARFGLVSGKIVFVLPTLALAFLIYKLLGKKMYLIFILNPLITIELIHGAHLDGFVLLFLFLAVFGYLKKHFSFSSVFLSLAFLTKIYPIFFLPFLLLDLVRTKKIAESLKYATIFFVLVALFYFPYINSSFNPITYYLLLPSLQEFNASFFRYFYQFLSHFILNPKPIAMKIDLVFFFLSYLILLTRRFSVKLLLMVGIVYLLFSPVVFPWHTLFLIPLILLYVTKTSDYKILYLAILMEFLLTVTYFEPGREDIRDIMLNVEYLTLFFILLFYKRLKGFTSLEKLVNKLNHHLA